MHGPGDSPLGIDCEDLEIELRDMADQADTPSRCQEEHPASDAWVDARVARFMKRFSRATRDFHTARRAYGDYAARGAPQCSDCAARSESDNDDAGAARCTSERCVLQLMTAADSEHDPWYEKPDVVTAALDMLCHLLACFLRVAAVMFHTRDLFICSRYDRYSILCHILLRLRFPALAEYVLSMPCFTVHQQDLLQIAYAATIRCPSELPLRALCRHGFAPLDALREDADNCPRLQFYSSKRNAAPPDVRDECIEIVRRAANMPGGTSAGEVVCGIIRREDPLLDLHAASVVANFERCARHYTRSECAGETLTTKYTRAELWAVTTDLPEYVAADTLEQRTWQLAVHALCVAPPLFFRAELENDAAVRRADPHPLMSLYKRGQLAGLYRPPNHDPSMLAVVEAGPCTFGNYLYAETAKHPGPHGRAFAVRAYYDSY
jgi:hypothetical protein